MTAGLPCAGQSNAPLSAPDIYKNFVGTWVGTCCDFSGSKFPVSPVRLVITIEKNGQSMRWDYTYGTKGQKGFESKTRFVTLAPTKGEMILQWKRSDKDTYKTQGLDQFALTGFGRFSGSELDPTMRAVDHGIFDLESMSFTYKWLTTSDGKNYTLTGLFKFTRETGSASKPN
jgi:hypothetical protein